MTKQDLASELDVDTELLNRLEADRRDYLRKEMALTVARVGAVIAIWAVVALAVIPRIEMGSATTAGVWILAITGIAVYLAIEQYTLFSARSRSDIAIEHLRHRIRYLEARLNYSKPEGMVSESQGVIEK